MSQSNRQKPWEELENILVTDDALQLETYLNTLPPTEIARSISRLSKEISTSTTFSECR